MKTLRPALNFINTLKFEPRRLFLIDSLGAMLSTLLYLLVLARFQVVFGVPQKVVYGLAVLATCYALYSGVCYLLRPKRWKPFLRMIAIANLFHCGLTLVLIFLYFEELTLLGLLYFAGEIAIVSGLAILEWRVAE